MTDEDGLATPLDDDILSFGNRGEVDFDLGLGQDICGSGHVDKEICLRLVAVIHAILDQYQSERQHHCG